MKNAQICKPSYSEKGTYSIIKFSKKSAIEITGTLTKNSKMPCDSIGLPVANCKTGAKLAKIPGSICSECYASKGFAVVFKKAVDSSRLKRLQGITSPDWVAAMVANIGPKAEYFRFHDSGDIQDMPHLEKIVQIAELMPNVKFWLPTREKALIAKFLKTAQFPKNLIVRISATFFDETVQNPITGLSSTAHKNGPAIGFECKAPKQDGNCGTCRACWSPEVKNVSYKAH